MRRCLFLALLLVGPSAWQPSAWAQTSEIEREWRTLNAAQAAHTRGREALARGDRPTAERELSEAAARYRQLLELNPLRKDLYAPLADTLIARGNAAAAYALCSSQVREGVRDVPLRVQLVRALVGMRRLRHAIEEAQRGLTSHPGDARLLAALGETASEAGEHELAIASLRPALAQVGRALPTVPPLETGLSVSSLRLSLARSLLAAKQPGGVATALADLTTSGPPEALLLLGQSQLDSKQAAAAVSTLQSALGKTSGAERSRALILLSQAQLAAGRTSDAIASLRQAGDDPPAMTALARIYMSEDPPNPAAAAMVLSRAAAIEPNDLRLCLEHAVVLDRAQKPDRALAELSRCESLNLPASDVLNVLSLRAELQLKLGHLDAGIASLREAALRSQGGEGKAAPGPVMERRPTPFDARLSAALLRRGLAQLATTPLPRAALADLEEAQRLAPSATTTQVLSLGLLGSGRAGEAVTLLSPLCEGSAAGVAPQLLAVFGRALRENGQPQQALSVLQRADELAATAGPAPLRQALRQDQSETLIALGRPLDALRLIEGNDETAKRQRAFAFLAAVRAYYQPSGRGRTSGRRGPFPPLRQAHEQPESRGGKAGQAVYPPLRGPIDLSEVQTSRGPFPPLRTGNDAQASRGPFPPLRTGSDVPEGSPAGPVGPAVTALQPQGLNDERQVLWYAQAALRAGTALSASERAEAMLYQVVALARSGQHDISLRRLNEVASQFDQPTLDALLGQGGFANLKARITLRGGDFYQGQSYAQQALQQLQPAEARGLQNAMAVAYTSKAIELLDRGERGDLERANGLLRAAQTHGAGATPENQARLQYNYAILQLYRGRAEEARTLLSRLDPQLLPTVHLGLGSYYDLTGDSRAALESYRRYLAESEPGDPQLPLVRQWVDVLERIYEGPR